MPRSVRLSTGARPMPSASMSYVSPSTCPSGWQVWQESWRWKAMPALLNSRSPRRASVISRGPPRSIRPIAFLAGDVDDRERVVQGTGHVGRLAVGGDGQAAGDAGGMPWRCGPSRTRWPCPGDWAGRSPARRPRRRRSTVSAGRCRRPPPGRCSELVTRASVPSGVIGDGRRVGKASCPARRAAPGPSGRRRRGSPGRW